MKLNDSVFRSDERAIYSLRELYRTYGYLPYKVGKFEEYDLYAHNKNFLVSDKVLTFTDTNGKLMALKPDVTLSIVKNVVAGEGVNKYFYNENVYRTTPESVGFKEIMQTGLECVGNVTVYDECEVIMLAAKSLEEISENYLLDLSHMGLINGLFENGGVADGDRKSILGFMESKNTTGLVRFCAERGIANALCDSLCLLTKMYLPLREALDAIRPIVAGEEMEAAYAELVGIADAMVLYGVPDKVYLDLSMMNDQNYYNGVIFKGYIGGISDSVLSGGRYDRLLAKLGKKAKAIGFAVYLDKLERFGAQDSAFDVDIMLVYGEDVSHARVIEAVDALAKEGKTVYAVTAPDPSVRCAAIVKLEK